MKVRSFITMTDNAYVVELRTEEFTQAEHEKMVRHGEPEVDMGGHYTGTLTRPGEVTPVTVDFTLPAALRRILSDFPIKQAFDVRDDPDSDVKAEVYRTTMAGISGKISTKLAELMALKETYIGENVTNL